MRNLRWALLALVIAVALVAASCGGGGETTTTAASTTTAAATTTTAAATTSAPSAAPAIPADHAGRTQCLGCHAQGEGGAPRVPSVPDHSTFADDRAVCAGCHPGG